MQHINLGHSTHHFHFPAVSIHDLKLKVENIHHLAQPLEPAALWAPDIDVRETKSAYHIEIEVPCVTDKKACVIHWISPRTLVVRGDIRRPDITGKPGRSAVEQGEDTIVVDAENASLPAAGSSPPDPVAASPITSISPWEKLDLEWSELTNGNGLKKVVSHEVNAKIENSDAPTFLLSERKVGPWQRTFTLPLDVDMKGLKATLNGGLLSIDLPKKDMAREPKVKVEIK